MNDLVIIGAGGLGREVAWLVERINEVTPTWNLCGFIDDSPDKQGTTINGYPILGDVNWLIANGTNKNAVCAVGSAKVRKNIVGRLAGIRFATLIDPSVYISNRVQLGEGCIICAGSIVTVNITLGRHVIVNWNSFIGHDAVIDDFVTLYPTVNIAGNTKIGECVECGAGSQVIQQLSVGKGTIIGAGTVVIRDLPEECTAVGVPAKVIKEHL